MTDRMPLPRKSGIVTDAASNSGFGVGEAFCLGVCAVAFGGTFCEVMTFDVFDFGGNALCIWGCVCAV